MLTPDELEGAGDDAAREAGKAEGDLLDFLVGLLLGGAALSATAAMAAMAVGTRTTRMLDMVDARMPGIREAVRRDAEELARKSDERDRRAVGGPEAWRETAERATEEAMSDLDALRLDMVEGAKSAYLEAVAKAAAQVRAGTLTEDQATRQAVLALEEQGVRTVDYADTGGGARKVSSSVDVAVRRAVRTHVSRAAGEASLARCREYGTGLVEVSSHGGARPSHAVWQGRCYSLDGEREIDGVVYRDFRTATGYGTGAGLCGWNCRHSFGPYRHGAPRQYEPNPVSETGYTDAELYALSQRQRACERAIRAAKRELIGARRLYESDPSIANQVAVEKARRKVADRQASVRKLVSDANARCAKGTALLRRPDREWVAGASDAMRPGASEVPGLQRFKAFPQTADTMKETHGISRLNREQINALQRRSDRAFSDMTVEQLDAVSGYTTGEHNLVNQHLYGRKQTAHKAAIAEKIIGQLDKAIAKYHQREDVVVFSGTDASHYEDWVVGDERELAGFVSTSVRFKDAKEFYDREARNGNVPLMLEILVPKGTPCLFVGENTSYSSYQGELILGRGLKYRVLEKTDKKLVLEVAE